MVGDGVKVYHHEDDGQEHQIGGCHHQLVNTHGPVQTRVTYIKKTLEVLIKTDEEDWKTCFTVSKVELPKKGYIGFTAHTGALSARHDLLAVTTAKVDGPAGGSHFGGKSSIFGSKQDNSETSHTKMFLFLLTIGGFVGYGYFVFKNNERRHHF